MNSIPPWGVAACVFGISYAAAKLINAGRHTKTIEEEKAHALFDIHNQGKALSEKELNLVSRLVRLDDDTYDEIEAVKREAVITLIHKMSKEKLSSKDADEPLAQSEPHNDKLSNSESLANARIAIAYSVLRSPYRVEGQKINPITNIFLSTLCCISTGLASLTWIPLICNEGLNTTVEKTHWITLSILGIALGLNYLVRHHVNIGTGNLKYYSENRFSFAYQLAKTHSQSMLTAGDGRKIIWSNHDTGVDLLFDKEAPPQRAFEIVSSENSKFHELYLDLRSSFHGLGYSLRLKGKNNLSFPDGFGRNGFLQIFLSNSQKKFLNWPKIENGSNSFNGGVILSGDILLIDDSLEGSILDYEYKALLEIQDFMSLGTPEKLTKIMDYADKRIKHDKEATNKVIREKLSMALPSPIPLGANNLVLRLDDFIKLGEGECRHKAGLIGYLIERLINDSHLYGRVTYMKNHNHAWIHFSCSVTHKEWVINGPSDQNN